MCEVKINVPESEKPNKVLLFLKTLFHTTAFCIHSFVTLYGVYTVFVVTEDQMKDPMIGEMIKFTPLFLTNWNFLFQTGFLALSLAYDVLEWMNKTEIPIASKIQYYRDVLFSGLVVPMTCFISSMFWIVFSIDRELVFPVVYDQIIPWWFNHCVHTNITIVVIIETILQARRYPRDFKMEITMNAICSVAYAVVYYSIYFFAHRWLYAVFGIMTWWQVCLYQLLIWGSCFMFYFIQFPINRIFHREPEDEKVPEQEVVDTKGSPFMSKSWSLKYRSSRNELENSRL